MHNNHISHYETLSQLTAKMRDAAQASEWDSLVELEQNCSQQVSKMRSEKIDNSQLDESSRQRKIQLIKKILADDAQVREHTEDWMQQMQRIMKSGRQEQQLQRAYGSV